MSSDAYSARLQPDPWLRVIVAVCADFLAAAGLVLILTLPINAVCRGIAGLLWMVGSSLEKQRLERGQAGCHAIRLAANGEAAVMVADEDWVAARLLSGSFLLQQVGWLRLKLPGGQLVLEPLRGNARESHEWRRLQVIWRHIGA